jgi:tRNA pseudouridine55 synthase
MLLLDKSEGLTSFQALGACRRLFGTKKIGHAGTLDKFASGLLLVFVGEATRLVAWFVGLDKTYEALIRFGSQTATLDPEGEVVSTAELPGQQAVIDLLPDFTGPQLQIPPEYSAIHIDGKRAYQRVLAGEKLDLKARPVTIHRLVPGFWRDRDFSLTVDCSSGTYVRALARDLGLASGSVAHLAGLRRTRVGSLSVASALVLPDGMSGSPAGLPDSAWLDGRRLAEQVPGTGMFILDEANSADFRNGKPIRETWFTQVREAPPSAEPEGQEGGEGREWTVVSGDAFIGIVRHSGAGWRYRLVFPVGAGTSDS